MHIEQKANAFEQRQILANQGRMVWCQWQMNICLWQMFLAMSRQISRHMSRATLTEKKSSATEVPEEWGCNLKRVSQPC